MKNHTRDKHAFIKDLGDRFAGQGNRHAHVRRQTKATPEAMTHFTVANCLVPYRLITVIEKFLVDRRTGNISLNIKDGEILGAHIEEIVGFRVQS